MLPDRLAESVTEWLVNQPHVQVVSRDGFTAFRQGITDASRSILQVYDRWHFIRNAKKQLDNCLTPLVPAKITWEEPVKKPLQVPLTQVQKQAKEESGKEVGTDPADQGRTPCWKKYIPAFQRIQVEACNNSHVHSHD